MLRDIAGVITGSMLAKVLKPNSWSSRIASIRSEFREAPGSFSSKPVRVKPKAIRWRLFFHIRIQPPSQSARLVRICTGTLYLSAILTASVVNMYVSGSIGSVVKLNSKPCFLSSSRFAISSFWKMAIGAFLRHIFSFGTVVQTWLITPRLQ